MKLHTIALSTAMLASNIFVAAPALSADASVLPAQELQGNVVFISGGVGDDDAATLKRAAAGYPLELQFVQKASPRDEFLAGVTVTIRDRAGNVWLNAVSDGPFLLAKLPPGTYRIDADYNGMLKRHTVAIRSGKHERAVFVWAPDVTGSALLNSALDSSNYQ